jgi:hypothetical protein
MDQSNYSIFRNGYLNSHILSLTRKDVCLKWFLDIAKETTYNLIYFINFVSLNKNLLTSKQSKLVIKIILKNGYKTSETLKECLKYLKCSKIVEISSFTKLEFMLLLKDVIFESLKDNVLFKQSYFYYKDKFEKEEEEQTLSICNLLTILKCNIFTLETDPEIISIFCEMYINNCVKDLWGSYVSRCFSHFCAIHKIVTDEKELFFGFDILIKSINKCLIKFYCEKEIIPFLTQLPVFNSSKCIEEIKKMQPLCIMYLELLLLSEPLLHEKISYRVTFIENKLNTDIKYKDKWETISKEKELEIIDIKRLETIQDNSYKCLDFIKKEFPNWSLYKLNPKEINWNFPTCTHLSSEEMKAYLKDSYCDTLHLTSQGYCEFFNMDFKWITKSIKKFKNPLLDTYVIKNVLSPD